MSDQYPNILKLRAERILNKELQAIYKTEQANVARCIGIDSQIYYVDLDQRKVVQHTELKISYEQPKGIEHKTNDANEFDYGSRLPITFTDEQVKQIEQLASDKPIKKKSVSKSEKTATKKSIKK